MTESMPPASGETSDSPSAETADSPQYRRYAEFQRLHAEHAFDRRSVDNPEWFTEVDGGRSPLPDRLAWQKRILDEWRAESPDVATDRQAYVIVGPPGVGKTSVRHDIVARTQTEPDSWRVLDVDELRDRMLTAMRDDGQLDDLVQREARDFRPSPRELSSQLFTESGKVFQRAQTAAVKRGENVIIEGAYIEPTQPSRLVKQLQKAGYDVHLVSVDTTHDVALGRAVQRYYDGLADRDGSGLGGRCMPETKMRTQFGEDDRAVAPEIARNVGAAYQVASLTEYHVAGVGAAPMLRGRGGPETGYVAQPAAAVDYVRESPARASERGRDAVRAAISGPAAAMPPGEPSSTAMHEPTRLATDGVAKAVGATLPDRTRPESPRAARPGAKGQDSPER